MLRKIIHIDMDCFYAAVEIRDNPQLKGKPVAVGGSIAHRGVLATCNYEARKFGLHSAMPTSRAKSLCPNLILLPCNMELYRSVSRNIHKILQSYTTIIEPLSLDEAYLDVTDSENCAGSATWIAKEIRKRIFDELSLTTSAGIAPLKFLAKIASDRNKPNGQFAIEPNQVAEFIFSLPLNKIPGIGKVSTEKLTNMGLITCGDVQQYSYTNLITTFGKLGQRIWNFSHGIDNRSIQTNRIRKSIAVEITLPEDINLLEQGLVVVNQLYAKLAARLTHNFPKTPLSAYTKLGIKIKFSDFKITTLESSSALFSQPSFANLLQKVWHRANHRNIRLIGLQVNIPEKKLDRQLQLWESL